MGASMKSHRRERGLPAPASACPKWRGREMKASRCARRMRFRASLQAGQRPGTTEVVPYDCNALERPSRRRPSMPILAGQPPQFDVG